MLIARIVPASRGWRWVSEGFGLFRRNPGVLALMVVGYWFLLGALNLVPILGGVAATMLVPALSVGVLTACREIDQGRSPLPHLLFAGLRQRLGPLVALGGLNFICSMLVLSLVSLLDDGALLRWMGSGVRPDADELEALATAAEVGLALYIPVFLAFWYAPQLVAWHDHSLGKSLFFSFFACLRNWRAFLVYGVTLVLLGGVIPGLAVGLLAGGGNLAVLLSVPFLMAIAPIFFASFYLSYRDVFSEAADDETPDGVEPSAETPRQEPSSEADGPNAAP
ncbi:putative transmembrane protein [Oryzomicrobium terrae]|uniref:Putative transmembrane protein n=1 Tax=Oryzomicrobium terrae TaxID=1735038 RepID=A0A5C1EBS6_9RHOO|nr:BPSS1780 family membrane protein [Oryzomicrobium terrae]QEL66343.1 putative transmembrane protein [Oryzomicrobium terrae]